MKDPFDDLVTRMYKGGILYQEAIHEFKRAFLTVAMQENRGNLSRAALRLGVHRNTLSRTITELEVNVDALRPARRPPGSISSTRTEKKVAR